MRVGQLEKEEGGSGQKGCDQEEGTRVGMRAWRRRGGWKAGDYEEGGSEAWNC